MAASVTTEEELKQLQQENEELRQTIKTLEQTNETLKQQNADLVDEVARLARWVYGKRSEQIRSEQKDLFEDVSVFFVPEQTGEQSESAAPAAK
ncbi:hypothetical protein AAULR_26131, partial [Lacticaseibacillus rhamnosus MTCC 5462]